MKRPISTLMTQPVCSVDLDDKVAQVEQVLTRNKLSWAPVLQAGRIAIGVISATDLLQFHVQGGDGSTMRAWQLCTYKPISVDEATPLRDVAQAMVEQSIHHVIVTGPTGIVGVVSSLDFVRTFVDA